MSTAAKLVNRHQRALACGALMWATEKEVSALVATSDPQILLGARVLVIDRPPCPATLDE